MMNDAVMCDISKFGCLLGAREEGGTYRQKTGGLNVLEKLMIY